MFFSYFLVAILNLVINAGVITFEPDSFSSLKILGFPWTMDHGPKASNNDIFDEYREIIAMIITKLPQLGEIKTIKTFLGEISGHSYVIFLRWTISFRYKHVNKRIIVRGIRSKTLNDAERYLNCFWQYIFIWIMTFYVTENSWFHDYLRVITCFIKKLWNWLLNFAL